MGLGIGFWSWIFWVNQTLDTQNLGQKNLEIWNFFQISVPESNCWLGPQYEYNTLFSYEKKKKITKDDISSFLCGMVNPKLYLLGPTDS